MKVFLDSIGCRLNQSEIETIGRQFRAQGNRLVPDPDQADLAVINTCAVTVQAAADSRKTIRRATRAGAKEVVVTGCWATLNPEGAATLPMVSQVVLNDRKDHLVADYLMLPTESFELEPLAREPLPGARLRTRAFVKVQDGCDNRCTFCVTTILRGPGRSLPVEEIVLEVQAAVLGGVQEVVITGVHLGSWGQDSSNSDNLKKLIREILSETNVPRLRLSSLEPWDLDEEFFDLWVDEPRLCPHLHLPLQSGCDNTLRRMARKTTQESFKRLVDAARAVNPEMAITTDLIAGFPGETEDDFICSLEFVREMQFSGGHVFTYSERPGTAASKMPDKVPHLIRKDRNARLRAILADSGTKFRTRFLGRSRFVLWESAIGLGPDGWLMTGLTDNYLRINAVAKQDMWNQLSPVYLSSLDDNVLKGEILTESNGNLKTQPKGNQILEMIMGDECIFCNIISGKIPSEHLYHDEIVTAFRDINPVAPTHVLIVPNKHIASTNELSEEDEPIIGRLFTVARKLAEQGGIVEDGYRLIVNTGPHAGQVVFHLHLHLIGGRKMKYPMG
jgi:threonylcarbamoyladenosine tRNA methylthiotransferase MtaB